MSRTEYGTPMQILDHGVEQAGAGIVVFAVGFSVALIVVAALGYLYWRRRTTRL